MVVVEYLYEDMKRLVDLPLGEMLHALNFLGAPSEYEPGVKKIVSELTPNRPDWYSMEGIARALKAYHTGIHPAYHAEKSGYKVTVDPSVAKIRPYTVCAVVKDLQFNDQRIVDMVLLQEKLHATLGRKVKKFALGVYPLHAIKFPVRYTTMKPADITYVPLGYEKEMGANEILEQHKKGQQYGHLIKHLDRYPVFVDAAGKIMSLVPIVNSAGTGKVDTTTREVFIEITGMDMNAGMAALNILACTFADMGGTVYSVEVDYGERKILTPDLKPKTMKLELARINRVLGLELDAREAGALLMKMGYVCKAGKVEIPPYRADVLGWVDVMEDVAIAYGYNNFKPTIPDFFSPGRIDRRYEHLDEVMKGLGFLEVKTFTLTNKEKLAGIGFKGEVAEIANPNTVEYTVVRPHLLVDMLEVFAVNKTKGLPQKFYEIGIAHQGGKEKKMFVMGLMDKTLEFSDVRGYLQAIASEEGFSFSLQKEENPLFVPGLSCALVIKGKEGGVFGKVSKGILKKFGLGFEVYLCGFEV